MSDAMTGAASTSTPSAAGDSGDLGLSLPLHGLRLIEASAGTGKTFALVTVLLRLVLERGAPLPQLLAVTFTRAAAQELRTRLRHRLQAARRVLEGATQKADDAEAAAARAVLEQAAPAVESTLLDERLQSALLQLDEAQVSTIHGFCQRALREFGFRAGVLADAVPVDAAPEAWAEVAAQVWRRAAGEAGDAQVHALLRALWATPAALARDLPALCDGARELWPRAETSEQARALHALQRDAQQAFAENMARRGERTQDRLIEAVWQATENPDFSAALAERWPLLLIDEFQDTDPRQWDIFRRMFDAADPARRLLCLIGDPKQAIYRFRGGDLETYLRAREDVRAAAVQSADAADEYELDANYRSRPQLLHALDVLFALTPEERAVMAADDRAGAADEDGRGDAGVAAEAGAAVERELGPFRTSAIEYHSLRAAGRAADGDLRVDGGTEPALSIHWLGAPEPDRSQHHATNAHKGFREKEDELALMCDAAVAQIARLLAAGTLHIGDAPPRPLQPGDIAVLTRSNDEATRMHQALARAGLPSALLSKGGVFGSEAAQMLRSLLRALAKPGDGGLFRAALATPLLEFDARALLALEDDPVELDEQWAHFEHAAAVWRSRGPLPALLPFAITAARRWLGEQGGARRLTDLLHLLELLQAEAPQQHGPLETLRWLDTQIDAPGDAAETRKLRLEADADLIQIGTIHGAKGLEYPVVVLPFVAWKGGKRPGALTRIDLHVPSAVSEDGAAGTSLAVADQIDVGKRVPARVWMQKDVLMPDAQDMLKAQAEREDAAELQRLLYVALTRARNALHVVWSRSSGTEDTALHWLLHRGARMGRKADTLDAAGMRARLAQLERDAGGAVAVHDVDADGLSAAIAADATRAASRIAPQRLPAPARTTTHRFVLDPRLHSFSSLHARIEATAAPLPGEGVDPDAARGAADEALTDGLTPPPEADDTLAGSAFGNAVHDVLEAADFAAWMPAAPPPPPTRPSRARRDASQGELFAPPATVIPAGTDAADTTPWPSTQQPLLERALRRAGVAPTPSHLAQTARLVRAALAAPLPGDVRLHTLPATRCVREMGFHYRLRPTRLDALFRLLEAHGYPRLQRPPDDTLAGFMHGWIDLGYRDDRGRHYVVDYKTNRLPAYDTDTLARVVRRQDYDLQYLIYLLALYRWLRLRRGAAFDPAHDIGGAVYLFLRGLPQPGMHAEGLHAETMRDDGMGVAGIHVDPVSPALLAALDALFDGDAPNDGGPR